MKGAVVKTEFRPYLEIREHLRTLDVLVCEHKDWFWKAIGHTAGVYQNSAGQLMVFESTTQNRFTKIKGVQLSPMGTWLHYYPGKVYVRQLNIRDLPVARPTFHELRDAFIRQTRGTSYPNLNTWAGRLYLLRAVWDSGIFNKQSTNVERNDWIFCTDVIAKWYRFCGLLDQEANCAELEPDDVYPEGAFDRLLVGCKLGQMIRIK